MTTTKRIVMLNTSHRIAHSDNASGDTLCTEYALLRIPCGAQFQTLMAEFQCSTLTALDS